MQKMTDPPLLEDPETGVPLERVFHPIAVHFKGKGFYNTDYGTKKRQREKAAESEGTKTSEKSEKGDKGETASADSKSSEKTDTKKSDSTSSDSSSSSSSSSKKTD